MPLHEWHKVDVALYHDVHQTWAATLAHSLNCSALPEAYFALVERPSGYRSQRVRDIDAPADSGSLHLAGGVDVALRPPDASIIRQSESATYASLANRITVRHRRGKVVAVVEIVSPGIKSSRSDFRAFIEKSADLIQQGVNLLVIDPFPPGPRDPFGIHKAIWDEFLEEDLALPPGKDRTLAAYEAGTERGAYVNFVAVGDALPDMPLFLRPGYYVPTPLETSYLTAWSQFPAALRPLLETPAQQ